jgi:hypothetical protein
MWQNGFRQRKKVAWREKIRYDESFFYDSLKKFAMTLMMRVDESFCYARAVTSTQLLSTLMQLFGLTGA